MSRKSPTGSTDSEEELHVYRLRIHDAELKDAGEWKIEVEDKYGAASTTCRLAVLDKEEKKEGEEKEGEDNNVKTRMSTSSEEEEVLLYKLRIHDTDLKDAGMWKCEVTDKYGATSATCNLTVLDSEKEKKESKFRVSFKNQEEEEGEGNVFFDPRKEKEEPRFRVSLKNQSKEEGKGIKFTCVVNGNPLPRISWFKDDKLITGGSHLFKSFLRDGTACLEIFIVDKERDSGVYRCEAKSRYGFASTEAKLTVTNRFKEKSSFWTASQNYITEKTTRNSWDQYSSSLSKRESKYETKRESKRESPDYESSYKIQDRTSRRRRYSDTSYESTRTENDNNLRNLYANEKYAILKLGVKWDKDQLFYFREELKSKCIVKGNRVYMSCFVAGRPPFYSMWYKDGQRLSKEEDYRYYIRSNGGYLSLEIPISDLEDTGEYKVEVRNEQGRIWSRCYIQIEPTFDPHTEYKKPYFIENIRHAHAKFGDTVVMSCVVAGHPRPAVQWFKDAKELQENDRITIHRGIKGAAKLMIHDADYTDIGLYKCLAHSWAGRCQSSAKLIVLESLVNIHQWRDTSYVSFDGSETEKKTGEKKTEKKETEDLVDGSVTETTATRKSKSIVENKYLAEDTAIIFTSPPSFTKPLPGTIDVQNGDDLVLQCSTDGFPKVKVIWMHEMRKVESDENLKVSEKQDSHSLEINSVNYKTHTGTYTAKLTNGLTETESSCHVLVLASAGTEVCTDVEPGKESIKNKDYIPVAEQQTLAGQEEINMEVPPSESLHFRCEETNLLNNKNLHLTEVSTTGVQCHSSPLTNAETEKELPLSKESPYFSQPLPEEFYPLERDENVRLQCKVAGDPCPKIVWFKDGEKLENSRKLKLEWDPETRIAGVLLKKLHILDTGDYECCAYSENGCYRTKSTLHIKALETQKVETIQREEIRDRVPPKFLAELKDKKILKGSCAQLECVIQGVPEPDVKWFRDGLQLTSIPAKILIVSKEGHYSLSIENYQLSDRGCYTCVAANIAGSSSSSANLSVETDDDTSDIEPCPPEITGKMEGLVISQGGVAVFKCSAKGNPLPKFKWQRDMLDISQSHKITITSTDTESTLTISNVKKSDNGMYVCAVRNKLGRAKISARLIVNESSDKSRRMTWTGESTTLPEDDDKSQPSLNRSGSMDISEQEMKSKMSENNSELKMKKSLTGDSLSGIIEEVKTSEADIVNVSDKLEDTSKAVVEEQKSKSLEDSNKVVKKEEINDASYVTTAQEELKSSQEELKSSSSSAAEVTQNVLSEEKKADTKTESSTEVKEVIEKKSGKETSSKVVEAENKSSQQEANDALSAGQSGENRISSNEDTTKSKATESEHKASSQDTKEEKPISQIEENADIITSTSSEAVQEVVSSDVKQESSESVTPESKKDESDTEKQMNKDKKQEVASKEDESNKDKTHDVSSTENESNIDKKEEVPSKEDESNKDKKQEEPSKVEESNKDKKEEVASKEEESINLETKQTEMTPESNSTDSEKKTSSQVPMEEQAISKIEENTDKISSTSSESVKEAVSSDTSDLKQESADTKSKKDVSASESEPTKDSSTMENAAAITDVSSTEADSASTLQVDQSAAPITDVSSTEADSASTLQVDQSAAAIMDVSSSEADSASTIQVDQSAAAITDVSSTEADSASTMQEDQSNKASDDKQDLTDSQSKQEMSPEAVIEDSKQERPTNSENEGTKQGQEGKVPSETPSSILETESTKSAETDNKDIQPSTGSETATTKQEVASNQSETADKTVESTDTQTKKDKGKDDKGVSKTTDASKSKAKAEDDNEEFDIDQLVQQAEEVLGNKEDKKSESNDISFEEVLAKSVLEESVTEAANEMDKIKNKRRKFSKSKKRSDSVDSSESLKNQDKDTSVKRTESDGSVEVKTTVSKSEDTKLSSKEETVTIDTEVNKSQKEEKFSKDTLSKESSENKMKKELDDVDGNASSKTKKEVNATEKTVKITEESVSSESMKIRKEANTSTKVRLADRHLIVSDATSTDSLVKEVENVNEMSAAKVENVKESTTTSNTASANTHGRKQTLTRMMSSEDFQSTIQMLDVGSLKANETRQAVLEQTTTSGKTQILEVSARRVSRDIGSVNSSNTLHHAHSHHVHHPPEILLPPETQYTSVHSEIELTVKVKAAHGAHVTWYHDGKVVSKSEHYEFLEEEYPVDE